MMLDREGGGAFDEYAEDVEEWWTGLGIRWEWTRYRHKGWAKSGTCAGT